MTAADLDAARLLLARMGITPEQLLATTPTNNRPMPTFRDYITQVSAAVPHGTRRAYATYWRRIADVWGHRPIDQPTPLEIKQLCEQTKAHVIIRQNSRGGRCATEHLIAAFRCLYRHAAADGLITDANNPALRVQKPRRLPGNRRNHPHRRNHRKRPRPRHPPPTTPHRNRLPPRRRTQATPPRHRHRTMPHPPPRERRNNPMATRLPHPNARSYPPQ
jgi:hypothetical protein